MTRGRRTLAGLLVAIGCVTAACRDESGWNARPPLSATDSPLDRSLADPVEAVFEWYSDLVAEVPTIVALPFRISDGADLMTRDQVERAIGELRLRENGLGPGVDPFDWNLSNSQVRATPTPGSRSQMLREFLQRLDATDSAAEFGAMWGLGPTQRQAFFDRYGRVAPKRGSRKLFVNPAADPDRCRDSRDAFCQRALRDAAEARPLRMNSERVLGLLNYPWFRQNAHSMGRLPRSMEQFIAAILRDLIDGLPPDSRARVSDVRMAFEPSDPTRDPLFLETDRANRLIYISPVLGRTALVLSPFLQLGPDAIIRVYEERDYGSFLGTIPELRRRLEFSLAHELAHLYLSSEDEEACDEAAVRHLSQMGHRIDISVTDRLLNGAVQEAQAGLWGLRTRDDAEVIASIPARLARLRALVAAAN